MKLVAKTLLGDDLFVDMAELITRGEIPAEWQKLKVVMISKSKKNSKSAKAWRPINLINCMGELAEKIVADKLHEADLFYKYQFESRRGRSVIEAVFKVVMRV